MRRREFITLVVSSVMWPTGAHAQAPVKIARIGFLGVAPASAWSGEVDSLRAGLRELGYVEGKNIVLEFRWATDVSELATLANEFVRL
jgi:putative ABC transport system substrate-binding protein